MTTDSETRQVAEEHPRSIDEIARVVRRSGYSLLTDEEVERYVAYREEVAVKRASVEEQSRVLKEAHDAYRQQAREEYERAHETFQRACDVRTEFKAVTDEQA